MRPFNLATWREDFKDREIEPGDLDKIIKPGFRVSFGSACSEPVLLTNQLVNGKWKWPDLRIFHFFTLSTQKFFDEQFSTSFRHNTLSIIGSVEMRKAINEGKADFTPINIAEIPGMLKAHAIEIDDALVRLSPADTNGYCSLGINAEVNKAIVKNAKIVIAHINPSMPRTMGDSFIKFVDDIDHFLYEDYPLLVVEPEDTNELVENICRNVARLIENGSTLNVGSGKITAVLPAFLTEKTNLALYSETLPEAMIDLIDQSIVNCSKNYYSHCMTSFIVGTKRFYEYVDDNPFIEFHPVDYIMNISNIARNHKLISIYSALSVDLLGQATNHLGTTLYGGMGGEADFMRGAALSRGGKAIVALPSVTASGESRIVPFLPPGPVSLRDVDVHYVVSEYGIAHLHGKTMRERVLQMISIAAPEHRAWLLESAKEMNYVFKDQVLPMSQDGVAIIIPPISWTFESPSNETITFRPVKPTDEQLLQDLYYGLSEKDRLHRFLSHCKVFSHEDIQARSISCDYLTSMTIVGTIGTEENLRIVAEGAYYLESNSNLAEMSVTVHCDFRGQGIASHIFEKIIELAREKGISGLFGEIHPDNVAMFHILKKLPYKVVFKRLDDSFEFSFLFSDKKSSEPYQVEEKSKVWK